MATLYVGFDDVSEEDRKRICTWVTQTLSLTPGVDVVKSFLVSAPSSRLKTFVVDLDIQSGSDQTLQSLAVAIRSYTSIRNPQGITVETSEDDEHELQGDVTIVTHPSET